MQEIFKDIKGYEGLYQISNLVCVKSLERFADVSNGGKRLVKQRILKTCMMGTNCGYVGVVLCKESKYKSFRIHRLIAIAFIPNPDNKPCVNHLDGNKLNNNIDNLEWCTHSENNKHALKTGLRKPFKHENNPCAKLNMLQVNIIRHCKGDIKSNELSKIFNISLSSIHRLHSNIKSWS
jgi:hypothetical protein